MNGCTRQEKKSKRQYIVLSENKTGCHFFLEKFDKNVNRKKKDTIYIIMKSRHGNTHKHEHTHTHTQHQ